VDDEARPRGAEGVSGITPGRGGVASTPIVHTIPPLSASTYRTAVVLALLFLMTLPNLVWILLDRGMWVSDAALYGLSAVKLHQSVTHGLSGWFEEALSVAPKPPILAWMGQFLVPVGRLMGNVDGALLLINFLFQLLALLFLFGALMEYCDDELSAITGCAAAASAPLFIDVSTQFYVQPVQLAAVCWFIYIMARSRSWDGWTTILQLVAATSLAMLSTISSPAFCVVPGAVALVRALRSVTRKPRRERRHGFHIALSGALSIATVAWYGRNIGPALDYGSFSVGYVWGGLLGAVYLQKLWAWTLLLLYGFGLALTLSLLLLLWVALLATRRNLAAAGRLTQPLFVSAFQIGLTLAIVSSSGLQESRYPLPLLGYVALIVGVSVRKIGKTWVAFTVLAIFVLQLVAVDLDSYGPFERRLWRSRTLRIQPGRDLELLEAITHIGDGDGNGRQRVALATSILGIYSFQVRYHLSKEDGAFAAARNEYSSVGFLLTRRDISADVDAAWKEIEAAPPAYFVLVNEELRRSQREKWSESRHGWGVIMRGVVEISERVVGSADYEPVDLSRYAEIAVYHRRVDPVEIAGRSDSAQVAIPQENAGVN
jgi:hypothetical protein